MDHRSSHSARKPNRGLLKPDVLTPSRAPELGYTEQPGPRVEIPPAAPVAQKHSSHGTPNSAQPRADFDWNGLGAERVRDFHIESEML